MGRSSLSLSLSPNEPAGSYISQEDRCCGRQLVLMRASFGGRGAGDEGRVRAWLCFAGTIPTAKCSPRSTTATSACTAPGRTPSALPPVPAAGDSSWARWGVRAPPASCRYQPPPQCPHRGSRHCCWVGGRIGERWHHRCPRCQGEGGCGTAGNPSVATGPGLRGQLAADEGGWTWAH